MENNKKTMILTMILLIAGIAILSYPMVSNWLAKRKNVSEITMYEDKVSYLSKEDVEKELKKAKSYNESLLGKPVKDPFIPGSGVSLPDNYAETLNIEGVMATIEIPKIDVSLPIYHGVSDEVLKKGVGHMEGTTLPIGGETGHTLLTGHTGLPSAKLFTDLNKMKMNDKFYIRVLGKELVYKVDQIKVIEPTDVAGLVTFGEEDYVTLITCTPYGVNSHRLLVRGVRINQLSKGLVIHKNQNAMYLIIFIVSTVFSLLIVFLLIRNRKKEKQQEEKHG